MFFQANFVDRCFLISKKLAWAPTSVTPQSCGLRSGATGSNHDQRDWGRIGHMLKDQGWNLLRLCCFEKSPAQVDSGDLFDLYFPMNPSPIRILLDRPWMSLRFGEPLPKHWSLQDIPFCFLKSVLLIQRIQLSKMGYKTNNSHTLITIKSHQPPGRHFRWRLCMRPVLSVTAAKCTGLHGCTASGAKVGWCEALVEWSIRSRSNQSGPVILGMVW